MDNKNIIHKFITLTSIVSILYFTGMFGVLITSIYHVFFEKNDLGITPSIVIAFISLLLILLAVIFAKLSKDTKEDPKNINLIIFITSFVIIVLFFLTLVNK